MAATVPPQDSHPIIQIPQLFSFFPSAVVPRPSRGEELLHALHLHLDDGRGRLPPAPPHQHLESENLANLDHHRVLLDPTRPLHRPLLLGEAQGPCRECQVSFDE